MGESTEGRIAIGDTVTLSMILKARYSIIGNNCVAQERSKEGQNAIKVHMKALSFQIAESAGRSKKY